MIVLILTPLPLEFSATIHHLSDRQPPEFKDGAAYERGVFQGLHHRYTVVVREPGMKNVDMALATERGIQYVKPQLVLLVGIAGGVKDLEIGDVVVAKKAYGYESGKEDVTGFRSRPSVEAFSVDLLARAQALSRRDDWKRRAPDGAPGAKVLLGPIAAGDKVLSSTNNETFQRLKLHYNDTLALEMEAIGFATAVQPHRELHALAIRGISDLLDHKSDDFQQLAAERAAAFAFELLYHLDASDFLQIKPTSLNTPPTVNIENAKNISIGSQISVGGNFHLGDNPSPHEPSGAPHGLSAIEDLIGRGRMEQALKVLLEYVKNKTPSYQSEVLLLSSRYTRLSRNNRMGLISNADSIVEHNQIVASFLELLSKIRNV